jgi:hypothetical protein
LVDRAKVSRRIDVDDHHGFRSPDGPELVQSNDVIIVTAIA